MTIITKYPIKALSFSRTKVNLDKLTNRYIRQEKYLKYLTINDFNQYEEVHSVLHLIQEILSKHNINFFKGAIKKSSASVEYSLIELLSLDRDQNNAITVQIGKGLLEKRSKQIHFEYGNILKDIKTEFKYSLSEIPDWYTNPEIYSGYKCLKKEQNSKAKKNAEVSIYNIIENLARNYHSLKEKDERFNNNKDKPLIKKIIKAYIKKIGKLVKDQGLGNHIYFFFIPIGLNSFYPEKFDAFEIGACFIHLVSNDKIKDISKLSGDLFQNINSYWSSFLLAESLHNRQKDIQAHALQSAVAQVFARNFAHNIGSHVAIRATNKMAKKRIAELYNFDVEKCKSRFHEESIAEWLDYMGEKLDLFEVARNEFLAEYKLPAKNAMLYRDVILPFCENTLLMDNIAHSEGLHYKITCENKLKINVVINTNPMCAKYPKLFGYNCDKEVCYPHNFPYLIKKDANCNDLADAINLKEICNEDIEICLTHEHAIYSIIENFIRNSAKHNKDKINGGDLNITLNIGEEDENYYKIQIYDNVSRVSKETLIDFQAKILDPLITDNGEIQKKNLGIADIKINAHLLKTDADITNKNLSEALTLIYRTEYNEVINIEHKDYCKLESLVSFLEFKDPNCLEKEKPIYNFGYQFKLCKPKKVLWIGKKDEAEFKKKGIICIENYKIFKPEQQTNTEEPLANYQFAILELAAIKDLTNQDSNYDWDDFLIKLPHRVLLNCTKSEIENCATIKELVADGRIQLVTEKVEMPCSKVTSWDYHFLKNCWHLWLAKYGINNSKKGHLVIYFEDNEPKETWNNNNITDDVININFLSPPINCERTACNEWGIAKIENNTKLAIFDHHATGYNELVSKDILCNNPSQFINYRSWIIFDKSSSDFVRFFYPTTIRETNHLFLLEAFDAAMSRVLILDERAAEMLKINDTNTKKIKKEDGFNSLQSADYADYADLANNGNVFFITNFLEKEVIEGGAKNIDFDFDKLPIIKLNKSRNICLPIDKERNIKSDNFKFDSLIIHRTYLLELFKKCEKPSTLKEIMHSLYKKFRRVTVISGGGYPHSVQGFKVYFKPYSTLISNFKLYPSKISLNNIL
jgi:hypothetical protein